MNNISENIEAVFFKLAPEMFIVWLLTFPSHARFNQLKMSKFEHYGILLKQINHPLFGGWSLLSLQFARNQNVEKAFRAGTLA